MEHHPDLSDPDALPPKLLLPPTDVLYKRAMDRSDEIKRQCREGRVREHAMDCALIAKSLDLAVLKPIASRLDIARACALVNEHGLASICVSSGNVPYAATLTEHVCSVVGFPHGNASVQAKVDEACGAMDNGAKEIDVVVSYGRYMDGCPDPVISELTQIVTEAHSRGGLVKAILETCYLLEYQVVDLCNICVDCGVDWVKTSTGFGTCGAERCSVRWMLDAVDGRCQVKASGDIKTYDKAMAYLRMGCTRLGSSSFLELLPPAPNKE